MKFTLLDFKHWIKNTLFSFSFGSQTKKLWLYCHIKNSE